MMVNIKHKQVITLSYAQWSKTTTQRVYNITNEMLVTEKRLDLVHTIVMFVIFEMGVVSLVLPNPTQ